MKNFKKPQDTTLGAGASNKQTIDVLNPLGANMSLRGKEWVNPTEADFEGKNMKKIKTIVQKNKEAISKMKKEQEIEEAKIPFKMAEFKKVNSKISLRCVTANPADKARTQLAKSMSEQPKNFYSKQNRQVIKQIERDQQAALKLAEQENKNQHNQRQKGDLPAYLVKFKKEAEAERIRTKEEIELNRRPPGTRILTKAEQDLALKNLDEQSKLLERGITQMSVTLYTDRAQNQMRGFVQKMDEVDKAKTVFNRNRVYIRD